MKFRAAEFGKLLVNSGKRGVRVFRWNLLAHQAFFGFHAVLVNRRQRKAVRRVAQNKRHADYALGAAVFDLFQKKAIRVAKNDRSGLNSLHGGRSHAVALRGIDDRALQFAAAVEKAKAVAVMQGRGGGQRERGWRHARDAADPLANGFRRVERGDRLGAAGQKILRVATIEGLHRIRRKINDAAA